MYSMKRLVTCCLALIILMMTTALADAPFLVHSQGWTMDSVPVEVVLKADVEAHMPFDSDRLEMLTPVTDILSMRLVTGEDEGLVVISIAGEEALTLQYRDNQVQLSCLPHVTYTAQSDPISVLLGDEAGALSGYDALKLSPDGETLLTDGKALLLQIPLAFEANGKRTQTDTNISGYGKSSYRVDYTIAASKVEDMKHTLLSICNEGWLKDIITNLNFSGKQMLRVYYTAQDEIVRIEYNGACGPDGDQRTVKLVGRFRSDDEVQKDYIELTSPAKKGKNKNNLTFERTIETNKKGVRVVSGSYKYTATKDGVTSIWDGDFNLMNSFTDTVDVISGEATFQTKLNGADIFDVLTLTPNLTISGTQDDPAVSGTLNIVRKSGKKVAEQALLYIDLYVAEPLFWMETGHVVDLSALDADSFAAARNEAAAAIATSLVRPLILTLGKDSQWFFRDIPEEAVQSIIDAAASANQ